MSIQRCSDSPENEMISRVRRIARPKCTGEPLNVQPDCRFEQAGQIPQLVDSISPLLEHHSARRRPGWVGNWNQGLARPWNEGSRSKLRGMSKFKVQQLIRREGNDCHGEVSDIGLEGLTPIYPGFRSWNPRCAHKLRSLRRNSCTTTKTAFTTFNCDAV